MRFDAGMRQLTKRTEASGLQAPMTSMLSAISKPGAPASAMKAEIPGNRASAGAGDTT